MSENIYKLIVKNNKKKFLRLSIKFNIGTITLLLLMLLADNANH